MRAPEVLQNLGAFVVVTMAMADEHVFNLTWVHAQLLDAVDNLGSTV
jgi:hypothetical protein